MAVSDPEPTCRRSVWLCATRRRGPKYHESIINLVGLKRYRLVVRWLMLLSLAVPGSNRSSFWLWFSVVSLIPWQILRKLLKDVRARIIITIIFLWIPWKLRLTWVWNVERWKTRWWSDPFIVDLCRNHLQIFA